MTYSETLELLYSRLPMFSRLGAAAYKADLSNTLALCSWLGNPQEKFRTIHIAGTNGKGSCSHMLAAVLQSSGYKTGLYTSPHLRDFRERIRINGEMIAEDFVIEFTQRSLEIIDKLKPSFFELSVGMAFEYFSSNEVDIAVIETGLGGRLDSTNVIRPVLSVITNIGMDHMNILGDTPELIAHEKAGIIKENTTVVIGESSLLTDEVFLEVAAEKRAPIVFADSKRYVSDWHYENGTLITDIVNKHDDSRETYTLDLSGYYQLKNVVTVIEAISQLRSLDFRLPQTNVTQALRHVKKLTGLHGRWEIIHQHPSVVLDVAHNADGIRQLLRQIELTDHHALHIIIGMVKDKEIDESLKLLPKEAIYYFTNAHIPRALPSTLLLEKGLTYGLTGDAYEDVNSAIRVAMNSSTPRDLILVCGSVFVVGEVTPL